MSISTSLKIVIVALFCLISSLRPSFCKADVRLLDLGLRITYDRIVLPKNEAMGLLGSSVLIDKKLNNALKFYSGFSLYSAVTGKRGGFFVGGISLGLKTRLARWIFDTGVFIGGGGGGSAPQGGGLMLRPQLSIQYDFPSYQLGLFFRQIKFPNGEIDHQGIGLQLEYPFQMTFFSPSEAHQKTIDLTKLQLILKRVTIAPSLQFYQPSPGIKDRSGRHPQKKMALIGLEAGIARDDGLGFYAEAAGAFKGEADGYAELLLGMAYIRPLRAGNLPASLRLRGAVGSAGGGDVDTAGGIIYKITGGLSFFPSEHLILNLDYGLIHTISGQFKAKTLKSSIAYQIDTAFPLPHYPHSDHLPGSLKRKNLRFAQWSIRTGVSRYLSGSRLRKDALPHEAIELFQIKFDRALSRRIYMTGQAGGAFDGGTGGYASGLFGLGFRENITTRMTTLVELLAGAGGGGGIASGGGGIVQGMFGLGYRISQYLGIQCLIGKLRAIDGDLNINVIDLALVLPFSTLESK